MLTQFLRLKIFTLRSVWILSVKITCTFLYFHIFNLTMYKWRYVIDFHSITVYHFHILISQLKCLYCSKHNSKLVILTRHSQLFSLILFKTKQIIKTRKYVKHIKMENICYTGFYFWYSFSDILIFFLYLVKSFVFIFHTQTLYTVLVAYTL